MKTHLGPPRKLVVRRREGPHHRAMRILWSVATIVFGVIALALAAAGAGTQRESQGLAVRVAKMIVISAAVAIAVLEFKPAARKRFLLTVVLGWTAAMAVVVWR